MEPSSADFSLMVEQQFLGPFLITITLRLIFLLVSMPTTQPFNPSIRKRSCVQLSGTNCFHSVEKHQTQTRLTSLSCFFFSPTFADFPLLSLPGWHSKPSPSDNSLEANLARVKFFRNELYGHVSTTAIDTPTFSGLWQDISTVLVALGLDKVAIERLN